MTDIEIVSWWAGLSEMAREKYLKKNFLLDFIYNSNSIEGISLNYTQTREVLDTGSVSGYSGDIRDLFSVANCRSTFEFVMDSVKEQTPITVAFLKKLHRKVMFASIDDRRYSKGERAGEFKHGDYVVGKDEVGALPEEVENEMKEFCDIVSSFQHGDDYQKTIHFVSGMHCIFENVHPFSDGNGRTGRWLVNYFLMKNGYPPIVFYKGTKDFYYQALNEYDNKGSAKSMESYLKYSIVATWRRIFIGRASELKNMVLE